ncbi:MAG TPA: ABC transporter ATP-binding protein [Gemmatimonadaceae bacterium]|nr:ABC transporter ATP-binding protein [Gemmatimonadaceae bacterium]
MIAFRDVIVRYPHAAQAAVNGVTFEARRGAVTALVGPNGSGKSTLVGALLRLHVHASGAIAIDDVSLDALDRRAFARRVAVVTQREALVFPLPVREYVALGRYPHEGAWRAAGPDDAAAVERAIALAGVEPLADRRTHELSGGEWQRVRIARALAQGGDALVLDEPTTFLDIAHEMAMFELFARLARDGMAVLLVSHQLNLVARFADAIVLLHQGRVAAAGEPAAVMQASVLEPVYDWPLVVTHDPAVGAPALLPLRGRAP